ncbi:hypothetical protein [Methanobrevibacter sp.]
MSDELYVSFLFPPEDDVSGLTVFKRIISNEKQVDVLQANFNKSDSDFDVVNDYIDKRIFVDVDCEYNKPDCIPKLVDKSLKLIDEDYKKIYSRSWVLTNHFVALEYKFNHPNVFWTAEFSDPLQLNLSYQIRKNKKFIMDNPDFIDRINHHISEFNLKTNTSFPLVENNTSLYYLTEYLTYLFADKLIFTNLNQRKMMLNQFSDEIGEFAIEKSEIQSHPTLKNDFYNLKSCNLDLNKDYINIAYFGHDYYGQRHFESLFYSFESLNHKFKDKIRMHLFLEDTALIKRLIRPLNSADNFIVEKPLKYFEFLNATTKFDVLVVNDVVTKDEWPLNPYLPSKLSDYLGSFTDIWGLCENGSSLSKTDLKYKSDINDFTSCRNQLIRILNDYGFVDDDCSFNDDYFLKRLTALNKLYESEFNRGLKLKKENKTLNKINKEILSSNSWKLTKPLRKIRKN